MHDIFTAYPQGLQHLLASLQSSNNDRDYNDVLIYQQRLLDNLSATKRHGDTAQLSHERSEIIGHLNEITARTHHMSFIELCSSNPAQPQLAQRPPVPGFLQAAHDYITTLHTVTQESFDLLSTADTIWPDQCKRLKSKFPRFNNQHAPHDNPALMQLRIKLLHMDQQADTIINLLDAFCPICNRASGKQSKQRQEVYEHLEMLLYEIKQAIHSMSVLKQTHE